MTTTINGTTGVSLIQDNTVTSAKIVDGTILPIDTQVGALPSMVRVNTANGYGSTNTKIRRFTNVVTNQGTDITYADSATLGASFTINTNGVYAIGFTDNFTAASWGGISINTASPNTNASSLPASELLSLVTNQANWGMTNSCTLYLASGAVVRPHTDGAAVGTASNGVLFTITRVA